MAPSKCVHLLFVDMMEWLGCEEQARTRVAIRVGVKGTFGTILFITLQRYVARWVKFKFVILTCKAPIHPPKLISCQPTAHPPTRPCKPPMLQVLQTAKCPHIPKFLPTCSFTYVPTWNAFC